MRNYRIISLGQQPHHAKVIQAPSLALADRKAKGVFPGQFYMVEEVWQQKYTSQRPCRSECVAFTFQ